ncbi:MAG: hypothetical protein [Caudoviricetes sp.]|nr:MAG: hypothetical protein [Caudoviricetes sp.]
MLPIFCSLYAYNNGYTYPWMCGIEFPRSCQPSGEAGHFIQPNHSHAHLTFAAPCFASGAFLYLIKIELFTAFGCADRGLVDVNKPAAFFTDHFQFLSIR